MTLRVPGFGPLFGIATVSFVVLACTVSEFSAKETPTGMEIGIGGGQDEPEKSPSNEPDGLPLGGRSNATKPATPQGGEGGEPPSAGAGGSDEQVAGGTASVPKDYHDCQLPIHEAWDTALGDGQPWEIAFGDPWVDTEHQRLVVSYDDVASRSEAFEGSYYTSAEVTLEGGTPFTPYPYVWGVLLPSLRRDASGTGIELGATAYGDYEDWRTDVLAGFSGNIIPNTTTVRVTTYVKVGSKEIAVKVDSKGVTYRSGWVSGFTWEKTNMGIFRFIGQNNSIVYYGTSDYVYVGTVDGCQKLSDEAVAFLYDE